MLESQFPEVLLRKKTLYPGLASLFLSSPHESGDILPQHLDFEARVALPNDGEACSVDRHAPIDFQLRRGTGSQHLEAERSVLPPKILDRADLLNNPRKHHTRYDFRMTNASNLR